MMNRSAVDRGMFVHTCYKTLMCEENKKTNCSFERIEVPPGKCQNKSFDYSKLGVNGIAKKGVPLYKGDVIIGKTLTKVQKDEEEEKADCSLTVGNGEEGIVDDIWEGFNEEGYRMVKVRIRQLRIPEVGDKFASRSSQKGVCGLLLPQEDMPFTAQGITPDLLINPHCMPSRMTMSQLIECLLGKTNAMKGLIGDATAFSASSVNPAEAICQQLRGLGYERHGNEVMYCGYTGEMIEAEVFIGPTYYQRLKHLVRDKMHCLTLDHEVLTVKGWKKISDVNMDDKVATLTRKGELEYQCPTHVWKYENYQGMMYHIKNQAIDLSVTGNHRMWVSQNGGEYGFELAENLVGKMCKYKKDAVYLYDEEDKKIVEDFFSSLSSSPTDKETADRIQQLCLHVGLACVVSKNQDSDLYNVYLSDHECIVNSKGKEENKEDEERFVEETCDVMCITVPNEVFYVRRNGKAVWTGNSRARGNVTMMHHQPSEGRSRDGGLRSGKPFCPKKYRFQPCASLLRQAISSNCGKLLLCLRYQAGAVMHTWLMLTA